MVVITVCILTFAVGFVMYWLGRGRRLNQKIKHSPEDVAVDLRTGEVIERGTPAWDAATRRNALVEFRESE